MPGGICKLIRDAGALQSIVEVADRDKDVAKVVDDSAAVEKIAEGCAELGAEVDEALGFGADG